MGWRDQAVAINTPIPESVAPAWTKLAQPLEQPAANQAPDNSALEAHFQDTHARAAASFSDYLEAGFQQSVSGLAARRKAPDVELTSDSPWYGRFMSSVAGLAGDAPAMVPGFVGGAAAGAAVGSAVPVLGTAAGGVVGGFAGAAALPAALRSAMMQAYTKGEVKSASDFVDRALETAWETSKAGLVGGATGGVGMAAKVALPVAAGAVTRAVVPTAAQVATMATVGKALEGQLPEPQDFLDAAVLVGGLHAAGSVAGRLRTIYAKTGKTPAEVVVDAARDPSIRADLLETKGPASLAEPTSPPGEAGTLRPAATSIERTIAQAASESGLPAAYEPLAMLETQRAAVPDSLKVADVLQNMTGVIPESKQPNYINFRYVESPQDVQAVSARVSEVFRQEIAERREAPKGWDETMEEARRALIDATGGDPAAFQRGSLSLDAEILGKNAMMQRAAADVTARAADIRAKGTSATEADLRAQVAAIETLAMVQANFLGNAAELGRALNVMKAARQSAELAKGMQDLLGIYRDDPHVLARMIGELDNVSQVAKFAREAARSSTWEKVVEAWKAGILSGPVTHMANVIGNGTFAVLRAPIDAVAAGIGLLRGGADRVAPAEPLAGIFGLLQGTADGLRLAGSVLRTGEQPGKAEQFRKAISGTKGEIIRLPFRFLSAEDAVFSTMQERGAAYSLAARQATAEGMNPMTREFRERIVQLVQEPTEKMQAEIKAAGERFTFNTALGEKGQAVQKFVRAWHLEWAVPFIRTPANIFEELFRMTPVAPLIKGWREDFAKGGAARDKALAEVAVGTGIMSTVFMHAMNGGITGAGDPDPNKRRVQAAAGWQPYSLKVGDTYYNYQRLQPLGTLVGLAADVAEVWDHMTEEEMDKVPKMLSVAFANAVTNQTFLQGITNIVNAMSDPKRFGPKLVQQYAGSVVPAIVAQPTQMLDPVVREVNSITDAVKSRIPGLRSELLPKRDVFGEPVQTKERLGAVSPVTETQETSDKVRSEAARLGVSVADAPKKVHLGRGSGKLGDVELTPEQRDKYAEVGGKLAHDILLQMVNADGWEGLPDLLKKRAYAKVFKQAHRAAAAQALPADLREGLINTITEKVQAELSPE